MPIGLSLVKAVVDSYGTTDRSVHRVLWRILRQSNGRPRPKPSMMLVTR